MCQASPVAQWWECPTSAWESVGYFWHGGYFLIFVNFFFTIGNEQCHFQSVQALYCFYFNLILYVNCYVILLHPRGKHCLITYCAFQKLESASQTSNFESEIVFAEKNHQFLACYMYVGIDWFGWTVLSESEIPNRRGLVSQFWKMEAVKESQEHSQDMNCNISLTCNIIIVFMVENFTFLSDMLFFSVSGYRLLHEVVVMEWSGGVAETCW